MRGTAIPWAERYNNQIEYVQLSLWIITWQDKKVNRVSIVERPLFKQSLSLSHLDRYMFAVNVTPLFMIFIRYRIIQYCTGG